MKAVIFNADDFGASETINAAVLRAHTEGVLTSASLMVNEPAADLACSLARESPSLAVGLHLALSNGRPALPPTEIPHLANAAGRFREEPARAGIFYFFSRAARREIRREVDAQFARFAALGLPWSHVDGHQHLQLHPIIWDAMVRQCEAFGVRRVRIPFEEFLPRSPGRAVGRRIEWAFFRALRRRCLRTIEGRGFTFTDRVYGHLETGRMTEEYVVDLLGRLKGRTNEIYLHPGTAHAAPLADRPDMDVELHALLSPRVRARLEELCLRLATFPQLDSNTPIVPRA